MEEERQPKYYLLKKSIVQKIENEEYEEKTPIPSERELMEQFKVSRITVRHAIDELVVEGYLYKIQGKGTYIKAENNMQDLFSITSCTKDVLRLGMKPSRKLIMQGEETVDVKRAKKLHLSTEDKVFYMGRVTYADDEALNYTVTYLPEKIFPGIEKYDFVKNSLYDVIQEEYGVKIISAKRTIEAVLPRKDVAEYLDIDENMPVILFMCTTMGLFGGKEVPIEYFKCYYRTDACKFYIEQVNDNKR